jgi:hypothetical protein
MNKNDYCKQFRQCRRKVPITDNYGMTFSDIVLFPLFAFSFYLVQQLVSLLHYFFTTFILYILFFAVFADL